MAADDETRPPALRAYPPSGDRIDEVEYHPSYERLAEAGFESWIHGAEVAAADTYFDVLVGPLIIWACTVLPN